ncbi:Retrovirus-related Pol polyprotein like [Argiope bruennichi]|uniref:Retrovirus-related Pol polyprotein like n=1 Tax=Argiope bruennichi TaxID=94029 RepID=A0A8T0FL00_ARGBR|nr:Retrovirus-related Pol polyprotein like [Argiope bruennichi]
MTVLQRQSFECAKWCGDRFSRADSSSDPRAVSGNLNLDIDDSRDAYRLEILFGLLSLDSHQFIADQLPGPSLRLVESRVSLETHRQRGALFAAYSVDAPVFVRHVVSRVIDREEQVGETLRGEAEEDLNERYEETRSEERNLSKEQEPVRKSGGNRSCPAWMKSGEYLMANIAAVEEFDNRENPSTYSVALWSSESDLWLEAMKEEIKALHENKTWEFIERPKGSKVINCRWVPREKN